MAMNSAARMAGIAPFHVMELMARAQALEAQGREIVHMEVGEPDFPTPQPVIEAAQRFLASGHVHYTNALGIAPLREAIAGFYATRYGIAVEPKGAFYLYAGIGDLDTDSYRLAGRLLAEAGVAATPGLDFGDNAPHRHMRFAYTVGTGSRTASPCAPPARSPCSATPSIRFLSIGPQFRSTLPPHNQSPSCSCASLRSL